ncbi:hypothetical protein QL285_041119 [Trifolium repens]|nr:hypothetical protein QL285_041119 [Trifolium repens]
MIIVSSIMSVFSIFNNAGPLFVSSVISLLMSVSCTISAAYGCSLSIPSTFRLQLCLASNHLVLCLGIPFPILLIFTCTSITASSGLSIFWELVSKFSVSFTTSTSDSAKGFA